MGFLRSLFKRVRQKIDDAANDKLHVKTLRDLGVSEQFIPEMVKDYRTRRIEARKATALWDRDENGNFK